MAYILQIFNWARHLKTQKIICSPETNATKMNIKIELIVVYDAHHKHSYSLNGMAYS